jgi:hypothetical protein
MMMSLRMKVARISPAFQGEMMIGAWMRAFTEAVGPKRIAGRGLGVVAMEVVTTLWAIDSPCLA